MIEKNFGGHSIDEDSKRRTDIQHIRRRLNVQSCGLGSSDSSCWTVKAWFSCLNSAALGPSWFSHPTIRYFSGWFITVLVTMKLMYTWKELVWHGQGLQDWVSSLSGSISQTPFWIFPAHIWSRQSMRFVSKIFFILSHVVVQRVVLPDLITFLF